MPDVQSPRPTRLAALLLLAALCAHSATAQDSTRVRAPRAAPEPPHATLAGWDRRVRLAVWDPSHSAGGLYTDRGVLQQWMPAMDDEYDLDRFGTLPTLADDAAFYAAEDGFRTSAGSITTTQFAIESEARFQVVITPRFRLGLRLVQQEDLTARREAVEIGYSLGLGRGHRVEFRHSLASLKIDLDGEAVYSYAAPTGASVEAAVGRLDVLNNILNVVIVPSPFLTDTVRAYRETPYWARGQASVPVGRSRIEAVGGFTPWSVADVRSQSGGGGPFSHAGRFAYGGLLAETPLSGAVTAGGDVRWTRARMERQTPAGSTPVSDFSARQSETRAGAFVLGRWRAFRGEAWAARELRSDLRSGTAFAGATVAEPYAVRERWTWLRLRADWVPGQTRGLTLGLEWLAALRAMPAADREALQREMSPYVPYGSNSRLVGRLGYRFSPRADILVAFGVDLDGDRYYSDQDRRYDGGHIRLRATW